MNPMTNVRNIKNLSERELENEHQTSWHTQYSHSPWIFVGGLCFEYSEGDIISVFSQFGEIAEINLVRDKETGKSKGYAFIQFEDQRSTTLTVDNLNGIRLGNRTIRVDHVENYKDAKTLEKEKEERMKKKTRARYN